MNKEINEILHLVGASAAFGFYLPYLPNDKKVRFGHFGIIGNIAIHRAMLIPSCQIVIDHNKGIEQQDKMEIKNAALELQSYFKEVEIDNRIILKNTLAEFTPSFTMLETAKYEGFSCKNRQKKYPKRKSKAQGKARAIQRKKRSK